ncbi:hypothetical protein WMZ97_21285 [Lentibacillus sp. N15]|uniref:hypothetical protein n=1 Tax=Lentibacillus songyuanensis TaxID=3136161 RepID=UPI0031BA3BA3
MKKQLYFTHNQQGFILPYVLFIMTIILLVISAMVSTYQNDIRISQHHQDQLNIETLIQMGREQFKQEIDKHTATTGSVSYRFPPGKVNITYLQMGANEYHLLFQVETEEKNYSNTMLISVDEREKKGE